MKKQNNESQYTEYFDYFQTLLNDKFIEEFNESENKTIGELKEKIFGFFCDNFILVDDFDPNDFYYNIRIVDGKIKIDIGKEKYNSLFNEWLSLYNFVDDSFSVMTLNLILSSIHDDYEELRESNMREF